MDQSEGGNDNDTEVCTASTAGTFHSNTQAYLTTRCRLLHPVEQIRALGMHFGASDYKLAKVPANLLQNLAGNAMEMTSVGLVFAACIVFLALAEHRNTVGDTSASQSRDVRTGKPHVRYDDMSNAT